MVLRESAIHYRYRSTASGHRRVSHSSRMAIPRTTEKGYDPDEPLRDGVMIVPFSTSSRPTALI
jgi:hypothetical protein